MRIIAARSLRDWGAAAVAVCASVLLSPSVSEAGCGDYVQIRGGLAPMAHSMPDQPTDADGEPGGTAGHGSPHCPCQGPNCSDRSVPLQLPVAGAVVSIDRAVLTPGDALPNFVCCGNTLAQPFDLAADGFRLSILRPPR